MPVLKIDPNRCWLYQSSKTPTTATGTPHQSTAARVVSWRRGIRNGAAKTNGTTSTSESGRNKTAAAMPTPTSAGPASGRSVHTSIPSTIASDASVTPGSENISVLCHSAGVRRPNPKAVATQTQRRHPSRRPIRKSTDPEAASTIGFASVRIDAPAGRTARCTASNGRASSVVPKPYDV